MAVRALDITKAMLPGPFTLLLNAVAVEKIQISNILDENVTISMETKTINHVYADGQEMRVKTGIVFTLEVIIDELDSATDMESIELADNGTLTSNSTSRVMTFLDTNGTGKTTVDIDGGKTKIIFTCSGMAGDNPDACVTFA